MTEVGGGGGQPGGTVVGGGSAAGGTEEAEDALQETGALDWASADLQGADAPDATTGPGAEAVFLGRPARIQQDAGSNQNRRKDQSDRVADGVQGETAAIIGKR